MPGTPFTLQPRRLVAVNTLLAAVLWSAGVGASWWWSIRTHEGRVFELAKVEANTNINKDWAFRRWGTSHGGVYVPPDAKTPPNPYLTVPDRDVVTREGKQLTLMNPAYMLRQIMHDYTELYGVRGHITSLILTNPINTPDPWEEAALRAFQRGVREMVEVTELDGQPYLRMIRAIPMEQGCMKCHEKTGVKVGEVRGGISVAIPMAPIYAASRADFVNTNVIHGTAWFLGLLAIGIIAWRTRQEALAAERHQAEVRALNDDLERRVVERTAQLEAANKDLESFSFSVSHDLRAPLRAINGFSRILQEDHADQLDDEGRHMLAVVLDSTRKMERLIADILSFSRSGRQEVEPTGVDMTALARSVIDEIEASAPERQLEFRLQELPAARGDGPMLRQALFNLVANAVKFTGHKPVASIEIGSRPGEGETIYYVKDDGVGFDMGEAGKLFTVFQRLDGAEAFEGTGLGLAIVKRIVDKHGGRVWADGQPGAGATFFFTLPTAARPGG